MPRKGEGGMSAGAGGGAAASGGGGGGGANWASFAQGAAGSGGGGSLGWWGKVVEAIGYTGQYGQRLLGAWGTYYQAKMAARMDKLQAEQMRFDAQGRLWDAEALTTSAGKAQKAGEDEAVNRYLQLGQDIGRVYAGAAGAGIDVTSRSVRRVDSAARQMAARDVKAINANAADRANAYVAEATSAKIDYINQMAQAKMVEINANYQRKMAKSSMRSQAIGATGRFASSLANMAW